MGWGEVWDIGIPYSEGAFKAGYTLETHLRDNFHTQSLSFVEMRKLDMLMVKGNELRIVFHFDPINSAPHFCPMMNSSAYDVADFLITAGL